jgi:Na+/melibiose symporter-like transporter
MEIFYYVSIGISVITVVVVPVVVWIHRDSNYTGFFTLYIVIPIALFLISRMRIRNLDEDLKNLDFEIDLQQFEESKKEVRAEKILFINNFQLRRYYDLNLSQNVWVFGLGIFCIMLGIGVIGVTLYLVLSVAKTLDVQIVTAAVGSVSSFMTSYIAAIYLRMHASATSNLGIFHSRLVETHQLLFGNLLASRIEDDKTRWQTLSQLALHASHIENTGGSTAPSSTTA